MVLECGKAQYSIIIYVLFIKDPLESKCFLLSTNSLNKEKQTKYTINNRNKKYLRLSFLLNALFKTLALYICRSVEKQGSYLSVTEYLNMIYCHGRTTLFKGDGYTCWSSAMSTKENIFMICSSLSCTHSPLRKESVIQRKNSLPRSKLFPFWCKPILTNGA